MPTQYSGPRTRASVAKDERGVTGEGNSRVYFTISQRVCQLRRRCTGAPPVVIRGSCVFISLFITPQRPRWPLRLPPPLGASNRPHGRLQRNRLSNPQRFTSAPSALLVHFKNGDNVSPISGRRATVTRRPALTRRRKKVGARCRASARRRCPSPSLSLRRKK